MAIDLSDLSRTVAAFLACTIADAAVQVEAVAERKAKVGLFDVADILTGASESPMYAEPGRDTPPEVVELVQLALQRLVVDGVIVPPWGEGTFGRFRLVSHERRMAELAAAGPSRALSPWRTQ
jgi:hypothetical protein